MELVNNVDDRKAFKGTVRDLMISMRSFANQQNDFYEAEKKVSKFSLISYNLIPYISSYRKPKRKHLRG